MKKIKRYKMTVLFFVAVLINPMFWAFLFFLNTILSSLITFIPIFIPIEVLGIELNSFSGNLAYHGGLFISEILLIVWLIIAFSRFHCFIRNLFNQIKIDFIYNKRQNL